MKTTESDAVSKVRIDSGAVCEGGHVFCLSGTMTITTLTGDELQAEVTGWGDPDPNDPKEPASEDRCSDSGLDRDFLFLAQGLSTL